MKLWNAWPVLMLVATTGAIGQSAPRKVAPLQMVVGSEEDNYLRYLQSTGLVAEYPWSIRGFSPAELSRLAAAADSQPSPVFMYEQTERRFSVDLLPLTVAGRYNSSFPYGSNDGAIWAGRGLTSSIEGGFLLRFGPVSALFNPIAFRAENSSFDLFPNGQGGRLAFADALFPGGIDRPQRFGTSAYGRVDLGQSTIRIDTFGVTAGVSTADMGWGPMHEYEYIFSGNAPGFPHAFVGTSTPRNVFVGHLHAKLIWGELLQSDYSPVQGTSYYSSRLETGTRRFASGLIVVFQPRGIPGLELGGARFFHSAWPKEGPPRSYFTKPFESIVKKGLAPSFGFADDRGGGDNQLASAFARWVLPHNGLEVYGEYGREDHNYDLRDLVQEPDHSRSYGLGARKVLSADSSHLSAIRAELINYQLPTLGRNRGEGGIYLGSVLTQGHTNRGQVMGADAGVGTGAASTLAWDRFDRRGRLSVIGSRTVRAEDGTFYVNGVVNPGSTDVLYALGVERVRTVRGLEISTAATIARDFNRNFRASAWNLNAIVSFRYRPGRR